MRKALERERERERERELRREGGKSLLAYVKGVDPYLIHIDRPTTIRSPEHNYNYNYQMAPSKRGAGGGSATHKEPT